jgi:hypothetical protein
MMEFFILVNGAPTSAASPARLQNRLDVRLGEEDEPARVDEFRWHGQEAKFEILPFWEGL